MMTWVRNVGVLAAGVALLTSCDGRPMGPAGEARLQVLLTDAPADYIASAEVEISRIYLQRGEDAAEGEEGAEEAEAGARVDLFNDADNPKVYDLLLLRDGVTADLTGAVEIPTGDYAQLRLVVKSATVTLAEGFEFSDGSTERALAIPSGAQSGIKVQLTDAVAAEAGATTVVLVDFDVNENFVIQGNPDTAAGIQGILFKPVLREKSRSVEDTESGGT